MGDVLKNFREKTKQYFSKISGLTDTEIEEIVKLDVQQKLYDEYVDVEIINVVLYGSRCRGLENESSDIDILLEYKSGSWKEDSLFNLLHEENYNIGGLPVDINPIRKEESGELERYLLKAEEYLEGKRSKKMLKDNLKNWYIKKYPTDDLGLEIPENLTFESFYNGMQEGFDVYNMLRPAADSVIRERIFDELSQRLEVDYDEIYRLWLNKKSGFSRDDYPNAKVLFKYPQEKTIEVSEYVREAKFVSVWDGGTELETDCRVDLQNGRVFDIETSDAGDFVEICEGEYILFEDGEKFAVTAICEEGGFWYDEPGDELSKEGLMQRCLDASFIHGSKPIIIGDNAVVFPIEFEDEFTPAEEYRLKQMIIEGKNKAKEKVIDKKISNAQAKADAVNDKNINKVKTNETERS